MIFKNHSAKVLQLVECITIWKKLEFSIAGFKILSILVREEPVLQLKELAILDLDKNKPFLHPKECRLPLDLDIVLFYLNNYY